MKKRKGFILSIFLIILGISILILNMILKKSNWYLRSWLITLAPIAISIGVVLIGILILKIIKIKPVKILFIIIWILFSMGVCFVEVVCLSWIIKFDSAKEIDDEKYLGVEYYDNRLRKTVYYYSNYNFFAYNKTHADIEDFYDYDNYGIPKTRTFYNENNKRYTLIYDENGDVTEILYYDEYGNKVEEDEYFNDNQNDNIKYNHNYGIVFNLTDNELQLGYDENEINAINLSENLEVINYENRRTIDLDDISIGDYVEIYIPEKASENKTIIFAVSSNYITEKAEEMLLNTYEFDAILVYYNETEEYCIGSINLEEEEIYNFNVRPKYYIKLGIVGITKSYLGSKENPIEEDYGYPLNQMCHIELGNVFVKYIKLDSNSI